MGTNNVQLVEIRGLQIIVHGKCPPAVNTSINVINSFLKGAYQNKMGYNLLINIRKGRGEGKERLSPHPKARM